MKKFFKKIFLNLSYDMIFSFNVYFLFFMGVSALLYYYLNLLFDLGYEGNLIGEGSFFVSCAIFYQHLRLDLKSDTKTDTKEV